MDAAPATTAAPPCAVHPRDPSTATCAGCGLFLCDECAARSAGRCARCSGAGHPIPWEDPALGHGVGFWRTLKALVRPDAFFARVPWTGGLSRPIAFAALAATIGAVMSLLYGLLSSMAMGALLRAVWPAFVASVKDREVRHLLRQMAEQLGIVLPAIAQVQLVGTLLAPVTTAIELLIVGALSHALARWLGGTGSFEGTVRALAYAGGAAVLHAVPGVGGTVALVAQLLLALTALRRAHGLSGGRAFVVAAWPIPAGLLFGLGLLVFLGMAVASALR